MALSSSPFLLPANHAESLYEKVSQDKGLRNTFATEVTLLSSTNSEEVLRRFSLNGDGKLDFQEFKLAMERLGISSDTSGRLQSLFVAFRPRLGQKLDIALFCRVFTYWDSLQRRKSNQEEGASRMMKVDTSTTRQLRNNISQAKSVIRTNVKKLQRLCVQLDINTTGLLSKTELQMALSHIGIHLSSNEFQVFWDLQKTNSEELGIDYNAFLSQYNNNNDNLSIISSYQIQRIWSEMLERGREIQSCIYRMKKTNYSEDISFESLRQVLYKVGITMSNSDFSLLKSKLRSQYYGDTPGYINTRLLLKDLQSDNTKNFALCKNVDDDNISSLPAGKTTFETQNKVNALRVNTTTKDYDNLQKNFTLEQRIMEKMRLSSAAGEFTSMQAIFPGKKMTRGRFRQALAHLGIVARYAEVEELFWKLDPVNGGSEIEVCKLYRHLNGVPRSPKKNVLPVLETSKMATRAHQRLINNLLPFVPKIVDACKKVDRDSKTYVAKDDFIWAMQEAGVILSNADSKNVVKQLSQNRVTVSYLDLENTILQKCSTIVSPKAAAVQHDQKYFSSASAVMDQEGGTTVANNGAVVTPLEPKSTIDLSYKEYEKTEEVGDNQDESRLSTYVEALRIKRQILKSLFFATPSSVLTRSELQVLLQSPRLSLGITAEDACKLVKKILNDEMSRVTFLNFIRLLERCDKAPNNLASALLGNKKNNNTMVELSIRKKVLRDTRLLDLESVAGNLTAGVVIRHAFRGHAVSLGTVIQSNDKDVGSFDTCIRVQDLYHVTCRIGLELTEAELSYMTSELDPNSTGYISSATMLGFFTSLMRPSAQPTSM